MGRFFTDSKRHLFAVRDRYAGSFHFADLKTSTQISIKFTLFTMVQVFLFSLLANGFFFGTRYNRQQGQLPPGPRPILTQKMILGKSRNPEAEMFSLTSPEGQALIQSHRWKSISKIEDMYFMYRQFGNQLVVMNVTQHIEVQKNLIWISIYLIIFFGVIAYILSHFFVKSSLKKLNELLGFLDHLHIDNLNEKIEINGHPHDEINRVSEKFNEVLEKIHKQTLSLKDFVTNASHEMKTPLMSMNTEIDYAIKTKGYEQGLHNVKTQLKDMNSLLETLVTISRLEALEHLKKEQTDISQLTEYIINEVEKIYQQKHISLTTHIKKNIRKKVHHNSCSIIIKNILDNAYKFTPEGGKIDISLDNTKLVIKDSGKGIAVNDLEHIRERFWQADRSHTDTKSYGLGLYLTQLLVEKHGWTIDVQSTLNTGTTCTLSFDR